MFMSSLLMANKSLGIISITKMPPTDHSVQCFMDNTGSLRSVKISYKNFPSGFELVGFNGIQIQLDNRA